MIQLRNIYAVFLGAITLTSYGQVQIEANIDEEIVHFSSYSVSLSDDSTTLAMGSYNNDTNSGHVRVYKNNSGDWNQVGKDIDGEAAEDWSGCSVSLSNNGNTVAIGANHNHGHNGVHSGHVRVYKNNSGVWNQIGADIDGETANDWSGCSVSLSNDGTTVAIGAVLNSSGKGTNTGHVRVYKNVSGAWIQIGTDIDGKAAKDYSGASVSLSNNGNIVAIGAHLGRGSGYVHVYKNVLGNWVQIGADIGGDVTSDFSGWSVSLSNDGSLVAIGAYKNNDNGVRSGYARVYKNSSNTWIQRGADIDEETVGYDFSGFNNISFSGNNTITIMGAYEKNSDNNEQTSGIGYVSVHKYENSSNSWSQINSDIYRWWSNRT